MSLVGLSLMGFHPPRESTRLDHVQPQDHAFLQYCRELSDQWAANNKGIETMAGDGSWSSSAFRISVGCVFTLSALADDGHMEPVSAFVTQRGKASLNPRCTSHGATGSAGSMEVQSATLAFEWKLCS